MIGSPRLRQGIQQMDGYPTTVTARRMRRVRTYLTSALTSALTPALTSARRVATFTPARRLAAATLLVLLTAAHGVAIAQDVPLPSDTTVVRTIEESPEVETKSGTDSLVVLGPGFDMPGAVGTTLLHTAATQPFPELVHALAQAPGFFLFDLSTPGWHHGLSVFGSDPNSTGLTYSGIDLTDIFFGRPRFDFVPIATIAAAELAGATDGAEQSIRLVPRDYDGGRPLTEALYWTSNKGLQTASVTHSQTRFVRLFGTPGKLDLLAGYHGASATGEYPSSKLERGRQMLARVRYQKRRWSIELTELYNRGNLGQHAGVNPPIYRRLEASVRASGTKRQMRRNDVGARVAIRTLGMNALTSRVSYARQTDVFIRPSADTTRTRTSRLNVELEQPVAIGRFTVSAFGSRTLDKIRGASWIADSLTLDAGLSSAGIRFRIVAPLSIGAELSYQSTGKASGLAAKIDAKAQPGILRLGATAGFGPVRQSLFERNGYAGLVDAGEAPAFVSGGDTPSFAFVRTNVGISVRSLLLSIDTQLSSPTNELALASVSNGDTLAWRRAANTTRLTVAGAVWLRRDAARGFYLGIQPTFSPRTTPTDVVRNVTESARPEFFVRAVGGARYQLFSGDLDADLFVRATWWSEFAGLQFNVPTGLLALPASDAVSVPSASSLDIVLNAGIRTATLFLSLENVLAGTNLMEGNLLVPGYPLAEQRLRFGVYWPIFD